MAGAGHEQGVNHLLFADKIPVRFLIFSQVEHAPSFDFLSIIKGFEKKDKQRTGTISWTRASAAGKPEGVTPILIPFAIEQPYKPPGRFFCVLGIAKGREAEKPFSTGPEALAGGANHLDLF